MKKILLAMMVVVAICFTSCGNKSKVSEIEEVTEDSVATASLQTAEATIRTLSKQIEAKDATKLQKTIEAIKVRVDELTKTNPTIAQEYVADVQNFLKENASKVKAVTGNNAAVTATMEAIINAKPQSTVKNLVDSVDQDAKEAKDAASNAQVDVAKVAVKKKTYKAKETTKVTVEKKTKKAEETAKPAVVEAKTHKAEETAKPTVVEKTQKAEETAKATVVEAKTQKAEETAKAAVVEVKTQKAEETAKAAVVEAKTQKAKDTAKPAVVEAKTQKAEETAKAAVVEDKTQKAKDTAKPAVVEAKTQKAKDTAKPAVVEAKTQKAEETAKAAVVEVKTQKAKDTAKPTVVEAKTQKAEETAKAAVVEVKTQKAKDTAKPAVVEAKTHKAKDTAKPTIVEAKTQKAEETAKPAVVEAKTQKAEETAKPTIVEAKTQKAKDTAEAKVNEAIDKVTAEPAATVDAYYPEEEDDLAQNTFTTKVAINMSAPTAMKENGVEIKVSGGHVTANHGSKEGICYVVSGTTANGSLTILGDKKYELKLVGVDINNPDSAAINLLSKRRAFIVVEGSNKISDGAMSENKHKGAFYGNGKMLFNGKGLLEVYGNYHNGIHSTDYILFSAGNNIYVKTTQRHGIKANNGIIINGGIINVETSGEGAKGLNSEEYIIVNGGRTTVICTGNGIWDKKVLKTKGAACLKADSVLTINGGEIYAKATGSGGKGLKAGWECYINGGIVHVITEGNLYYNDGSWESFNYMANTPNVNDNYTSSPKGIKVGTKNAYGVLEISGGSVTVSANGDGINSSGDLTISGGSLVTVSTSKDGIDANGNMYLNGGTLIAFGGRGDAKADVDIDEQKRLYINGTSIFSIGGRIDSTLDSTSQGIITTSGSVSAGQTVTVSSDDNTTLATFTMPPYSQQNRTVLISTPDMTSGMSYTVNMASSITATATETISGPE